MSFEHAVPFAARIMEALGIVSMILGTLVAAALCLRTWRKSRGGDAFRSFRQNLGRAILLGREFLVAADIIRTVSERPTLSGVLVLGAIVLIRTFLSFTLEVELEGRWPWQRARADREDRAQSAGARPPPPTPDGRGEGERPLHA